MRDFISKSQWKSALPTDTFNVEQNEVNRVIQNSIKYGSKLIVKLTQKEYEDNERTLTKYLNDAEWVPRLEYKTEITSVYGFPTESETFVYLTLE